MAIEFSLKGLDGLLANLARVPGAAKRGAARGMYQQAEEIIGRAKNEFVPVDLGALKSSGVVQPPVITATDITVTMGFGGAAADYALVQHENLSYRHNVGGAKYLERPFLEQAPRVPDAIGAAIRDELDTLGK